MVALLNAANLNLGVEIFPARSQSKRPWNYIAVSGDDEESRSAYGGVFLVSGSIWCVSQADEVDAVQASKNRLRALIEWFGPDCPARGYRAWPLVIKGITVLGTEPMKKDRSFADVISLSCGVQILGM